MNEITTQMNQWFDEQLALCTQRRQELQQQQRTDEAVFEAIKINVYNIFRTVLSAAAASSSASREEACAFFLRKMQEIPSNWTAALEKAQQHGNTTEETLERLKLDTARQIHEQFCAICEAAS